MPDDSESANPLWLSWVKEWLDTARERNSKGITTYKHAYDSLKACPITFTHPSELQKLKGFGPKLCQRLTDLLKKHCEENGLPMPQLEKPRKRTGRGLHGWDDEEDDGGDAEDSSARPAKKPKKAPKAYVPAYRSGAHALVLALATQDEDAPLGMTKAELIEAAQPHCDSSFSAPSDPTKFYTAWNSMKTLMAKEFVYERGRPLKRYALTDEGWEVANRIKKTARARGDIDDGPSRLAAAPPGLRPNAPTTGPATISILSDDEQVSPSRAALSEYQDVVGAGHSETAESSLPIFNPIRLPPGSFTVHLVLDVREVRAKKDRDYMQEQLTIKGVTPIMRSLDLGDVLWVAKCHDPNLLKQHGAEGDEIMLDWIAERKRLDDLVSSIKDGRFHEQKFRLRRSGVKNVIYLVEEISMDAAHFQKYEESVQSAIASTQVVNGYFLKKTQKMDDTIRYLTRMTVMLKKQYESKALYVIPTNVLTATNYLPLLSQLQSKEPSISHHITYPAFASLASKSEMMTLGDVYLKMLMCTKGVTGEKAIEIQKRWKTPFDFVKAYERFGSDEEGKKRKATMVFDQMGTVIGRKKVPKAASQRLAEVWGDA